MEPAALSPRGDVRAGAVPWKQFLYVLAILSVTYAVMDLLRSLSEISRWPNLSLLVFGEDGRGSFVRRAASAAGEKSPSFSLAEHAFSRDTMRPTDSMASKPGALTASRRSEEHTRFCPKGRPTASRGLDRSG
jgi:hypothetical protein